MKVFIEDVYYPLDIVKDSFESNEFYRINCNQCQFKKVGYNYSAKLNKISFVLPKVFLRENGKTVFEDLHPLELLEIQDDHLQLNRALQKIAFNFYRGLKRFELSTMESQLVNFSASYRLKHRAHEHRFSYIDIVLSFLDFHKKYKDLILFKFLEATSPKASKVNWNKTVSKRLPIILSKEKIMYDVKSTKVKIRDDTDLLIVLFYSIMNYFNESYQLGSRIDKNVPIYKGHRFESLRRTGIKKLKAIRNNYFSDVFRKMYTLVEFFFEMEGKGATEYSEEFLSTNNYNIVFEEMVDKLLSDKLEGTDEFNNEILKLKRNKDGKLLDHIFKYKSLFDSSEIYYIGDSKYYKSGSSSQGSSTYKQFIYAKNIIQHHITKVNKGENLPNNIRYRDPITEGYNITPNFFIYGFIDDYNNWQLNEIKSIGEPHQLSHFPDRLFDRDSLFIFEYKINYLFILQSYILNSTDQFIGVRRSFKERIYLDFRSWFFKGSKSGIRIYELDSQLERADISRLELFGKCYSGQEGNFVVALNFKDIIGGGKFMLKNISTNDFC